MMPTGYTAQFLDDPAMTFEQWALKCARAFGPLIHMRDDSLNAEIPTVVEPSAYYRDALLEAEARVRELETMTLDDAAACAKREHESSKLLNIEIEERSLAEEAKHEVMRAKVEAWAPPTPEHENLKKFMLEQLQTSQMPHYDPGPARNRSAQKWLDEERAHAAEHAAIRREDWRKSVEGAAKSTQWLADLRASLTGGKAP